MSTKLRIWHANISAFIAPTILFFAISGSLQLYHLHEAHGGYVPSALAAALGNLHKDQVLSRPGGHASGANAHPEDGAPSMPQGRRPPEEPRASLSTTLLKAFFLGVALALSATTLIGLAIGVTHPKRARTMRLLVAAGAVVPILLFLL